MRVHCIGSCDYSVKCDLWWRTNDEKRLALAAGVGV